MRIAIFSEGRDDQAVIVNVLKGALGIESSDIIPLRPELTTDATDQSTQNTTLGGWSRVKKDCEEKERLEEFLDFNIDGKIVIHLDTAEAHEYGVTKPTKPNDLAQLKVYSQQLRLLIIDQIKNWTKGEFEESLWHAIAIEETEAWLLPLFISQKETAKSANPKDKFKHEMKGKVAFNYDSFLQYSKPLSKPKTLEKACLQNESLQLFVEECKADFTS